MARQGVEYQSWSVLYNAHSRSNDALFLNTPEHEPLHCAEV
jgi:hypothetical protein